MSEPLNPAKVNETAAEQTASIAPGAGTQDYRPAAPVERSSTANVQVPGYRMLGVLGRGGMGVVYKAVQEKANRLVALKMILAGAHADQHDRTRFHVEAAAAARMSHPNIVQLYEVGETPDGFPFFSLEFVSGGTLADRLKHGPLRPADAAALVESLARAMQYAHERGIVHRDLKPPNILLDSGGQTADSGQQAAGSGQATMKPQLAARTIGGPAASLPAGRLLPTVAKISDFGLAKQLDSDDGLTRTGAIMGSPSYMAPEQAFGLSKNVGPAADIYALGAILYECLTGRPPFKGATIADTLEQVRTMEPISVNAYAKEIPRDLETICLHCLHKEPHKRYASAEALADDLRRYCEGKPISVRPVSKLERAVRWCRRNPGWAAMIATVIGSIFGAFCILIYAYVEVSASNKTLADEVVERTKQTEIAKAQTTLANDKTKLAEARGEQALKAVGLFATDARVYCEDAMVPGESRAKLYGVLIKQLEKQADQGGGEATIDALRNKAFLYQTLCAVNLDFNKHAECKAWFDKGIATVDQWEKLRPGDPTALSFRATLLNKRGDSLAVQRKLDGARQVYAEARDIRQKLVGDPDVDLPGKVESIAKLADSLDSLERFDESIALREKICKLYEKDRSKDASQRSFPYREALCWTFQKAGFHATDYATRKKYLVRADELSRELMGPRKTPRNILQRWSMIVKILGELEYNHGKLAEKDGKKEDAEKNFAAASVYYVSLNDISRKLATSSELVDGLRDYSRSYYTLGLAEKRKGNPAKARGYFQMSWDIRSQVLHDYGGDPGSAHLQVDLFFSQIALGELSKTMAKIDNMIFAFNKEPDACYRLACVYALAITTIAETRNPEPLTEGDKRARNRYRHQAFQCLHMAHDGGFTDFYQSNVDADLETLRDDPAMKEFEATHQYRLGILAKKSGDAKTARAHFEKARDVAEQFMKALPRDSRYRHVKAAWLCARLQLGDHVKVIENADELQLKGRKEAAVQFLLARVYSLASAATDDPKLREQYRTRAVEALAAAKTPGGFLAPVIVTEARLIEEDDLDPLRGDSRFKKILDAAKNQPR